MLEQYVCLAANLPSKPYRSPLPNHSTTDKLVDNNDVTK